MWLKKLRKEEHNEAPYCKPDFTEKFIEIFKKLRGEDYKTGPFDSCDKNNYPDSKKFIKSERNWSSIYSAFTTCNNNYDINDLAYFYLLKRAKDKFHELVKKARKFDANFEKMRREYIEETIKKHNMQYREVNKDHALEDLAKRINNVKAFTATIKRRHELKKKTMQVQFDDDSNNYTLGLRRSLLPVEQGNMYSSVPAISTNPSAYAANSNNVAVNVINNTTEHSKSNLKEDYTKKVLKRKLANIVCGDLVYEDTQKIKLFDGKFFSAYIFMEENPIENKKNEKSSGKPIRSVINNEDENTIFVDKYSLNNKSISSTNLNINNNIEKTKSSVGGSSTNLLNSFKFKKINTRSLSEIPLKIAHSSSKSNLSQSSKLNLLQMKGRNSFNSQSVLGGSKKLISKSSLNLNMNNNNNNNNNKSNFQSNSQVNLFNLNNQSRISTKIIKNRVNEEDLNVFGKENCNYNNNNKEIQINQSFVNKNKSVLQENESKNNNSVLSKTVLKTNNSLRRSSTPIVVRDQIFSNDKNNYFSDNNNQESFINKETQKDNNFKKLIVKMNTSYGLSFRSKMDPKNFDHFKKDDFYYNKKFHA